MYRYLLFAYRSYEERGGIADLVLTFNTVEELQEAIYENDEYGIGLGFNNIFDIYDVKKNEVYCYETDDYSEDVLDEFVEKLLEERANETLDGMDMSDDMKKAVIESTIKHDDIYRGLVDRWFKITVL